MSNKMKISPEFILKQFSPKFSDFKLLSLNITTAQVSDAVKKLTGKTGVLQGIKPVTNFRIIGRAITVKTMSDDWGTVIKAIYKAQKGDIIVIHSDGKDQAVWGEMASKTAKKQGIVGTVVHGAVRDIEAIKRLNYPLYSKSIVPNAGDPKAEGRLNISLDFDGITVNPRDLIIADDSGVVVVPNELTENVLKEALKIKKMEKSILKEIEEERSFLEILGLN
jgi:3-hexulose-6-phosphate synthase